MRVWTFRSDHALRRVTLVAIGLLGLSTAVFYQAQHSLGLVGGAIAPSKMLWLGGAILLWIVLPALLAADARLSPALRRAFVTLLVLMAARALIEGWMLYVTLRWSPWYGIAHDAVCLVVLLLFAATVRPAAPLDRLVRLHLVVTAMFFVAEMFFAWYMVRHFVTRGAGAIYFVPDDPAHAGVLRATAGTVAVLAAYLAFFMQRWLSTAKRR